MNQLSAINLSHIETYQEFINRKNAEFQNTAPKPFKDIGGKGSHGFKREAWTFMVKYNLKEKVFIIERLRRIEINGKTVHSDIKMAIQNTGLDIT